MTDQPRSSGCLGLIFRLFGISPKPGATKAAAGGGPAALPYKLHENFPSPAELAFYRVLKQAIGDRYAINNKVRLWNVLTVARGEGSRKFENKISREVIGID